MEKKKIIIFEIVGIILLSIFFGATAGGTLFFGYFNIIDEGQFAAWANHMLLGKLMYQDIYITYGPLFVTPLYLLFKFFGPSLFLVRVYMVAGSIFGLIVTLLIMYQLRIPQGIRYVLLITMILLPVMQLRQGMALLCIFLLMQTIQRHSARLYFAIGITTVLTFFVSPDMGFFVLVIEALAFCFAAISGKNIYQVVRFFFTTLIGMFFIMLIFSFWASHEGWLHAYIIATSDLFSSFSGINLPNGMGFPNLFTMAPDNWNPILFIKYIFSKEALLYWGVLFYIVTFLFVIIKSLIDNSTKTTKDIVPLALLGFLMYSILIGRWGIGHFFFILSPVFLIGGFYAARLLEMDKKVLGNRIAAIGLVLLLAFFTVRIFLINRPQILANFSELSTPHTVNDAITKQQNYFHSVLSFVDMNIKPSDSVYVMSNEPALYMLMNKTNPTRYDLPYIVITKDKRYEVLAQLKKNPPDYIFENTKEWAVDGISNRKRMPEVSTFIDKNYREVKNSNGLTIYTYISSKE